MNPIIDPEFQSLVHPLTHEEKAGLEQQLISDGCLDPLRVWQEENILLDGHNRFDLCTLHNIQFNVEYISLKDRDAALLWIVCNQLSRRNSTEEQKAYLRGKRYELEKKAQGEHEGNQYTKVEKDHFDPFPTTADKLAKEFNVSAPTIKRDEQFAKGVDTIATVAPEVKQEILAGESELTKQEVRSMASVPKQAEKAVRAQTILTTEDEIQRRIDAEAKRRAKEQFDALLAKKSEKREAQKAKRKEIAVELEQANQKIVRLDSVPRIYRIIYADPPWQYGNDQTAAMPGSTRPEDHYVSMPTSDICALSVKEIAIDNSVLFMWATTAHLEESFSVIKAWGFRYKTHIIWDKESHNYGPYTSVQHEILIIATRGACTPEKSGSVPSVVRIRKTKHSQKPEEFRQIIEKMYPFGQRIELFARDTVDGWDTWGNES